MMNLTCILFDSKNADDSDESISFIKVFIKILKNNALIQLHLFRYPILNNCDNYNYLH